MKNTATRARDWLLYVAISLLVEVGVLYFGAHAPEVRADEDVFACIATFFLFGIFLERTWCLRRDFRLWIVFAGLLALHIVVLFTSFLFQPVFSPKKWTVLVIAQAGVLQVTASQLVSKLRSTRK